MRRKLGLKGRPLGGRSLRSRGRITRTPIGPKGFSAYKGPVDISDGDRYAVVKLRFEIPHDFGLFGFTREHPELAIIASASQTMSNGRLLAEVDIAGPRSSEYTEEFRHLPGIVSVASMGTVGPLTRYHVILKPPSYLKLANRFQVLLRFPRFFQNGFFTVEAAGRVSQLRRLIHELRSLSPQVHVQRFGSNLMRSVPRALSAQQYALLQRAVTAGYFDVPRRITLTGLAKGLGRSKSTVSRNLALIERELAEAGVSDPG